MKLTSFLAAVGMTAAFVFATPAFAAEIDTEITHSQTQIEALTTQLKDKQTELTTLQDQVTQYQAEAADYSRKISEGQQELKKIEAELKEASKPLNLTASAAIDGPQASIQQLRAFSNQKNEIEKSEAKLTERTQENQKLVSFNALTTAQINALEKQKEALTDELIKIQAQLEQQKATLADQQKEKEAQEKALAAQKEKEEKTAATGFASPLAGSLVKTSGFGHRSDPTGYSGTQHDGIDFSGNAGEPILAARDGIVEATGFDGSAGNYVILRHDNGFYSYYFHLTNATVATGQNIEVGQQVGTMGTTGNSTGVHLHFGLSHSLWSDFVDPSPYLGV